MATRVRKPTTRRAKPAPVASPAPVEFVPTHTTVPDFEGNNIEYNVKRREVRFGDVKGNTVTVLLTEHGHLQWSWYTRGR